MELLLLLSLDKSREVLRIGLYAVIPSSSVGTNVTGNRLISNEQGISQGSTGNHATYSMAMKLVSILRVKARIERVLPYGVF